MPVVRAARSDELDRMLAVMCESFGLPYAAARGLFYHDPYFDISRKLVLVDEDTVVSCLTVVEAPLWIGRALVRVGGIAGVATAPAYRRRGYAARLLTDCLPILREQGHGLASLFPYSYGYYRRLGWERGGTRARLRVSPRHLPGYAEARHVRAAVPSDRGDLAALYEAWSRHRTGHWVRDERRWAYLHQHVKGVSVYKRSSLQGYMLHELRAEPDGSHTLRVLEMVAATDEARRGLAGFLAQRTDVREVEYTASWSDLGASGLLAPGPETPDEDAPRVDVLPGAMFRLVDMALALEGLLPNFEGLVGEVGLAVRDGHAPQGACREAILAGDGATVVVHPAVPGAAPAARIEGDVRAWSQVLVGCLSLEDALSLNRLRAYTPAAVSLAAPLFPRREVHIPTADHF